MTSEQLLIEAVVKVAFDDYKRAIIKGIAYDSDLDIRLFNPFCLFEITEPSDEDLEHNCYTIRKPQKIDRDSCVSIIRDLTKSIVMYQYDIELLEWIFRKYDNDMRRRFIYYYGDYWVHPWDIVYNGASEPHNITKH